MRIIAGQWRGQAIRAPRGERTRPTSDRVREAVFSALTSRLGADLGGGAVLDAFAGSGALGLEALSRGAGSATFIENGRDSLAVLRANVATLDASNRAKVMASDAFSLARRGIPGGPFSLILLDPPYTLDAAVVGGLLESLAANGQLQQGAFVSWEHSIAEAPLWPIGFSQLARKRYGSTEVDIAIYERGAADQ